jgi:uncharacterized membrane protein required for colicin V production
LFLCIYAGYKRGLAKCLINVLAFIIAVVVAAMLFKPASAIVRSNTEIDENIKTSIVNVFEEEEKEKKEDNEKESPIMEYLTEKAKDATEEKKKEIVENAANDISIKIVDVLSFIGIFIIVRFLLVFVKALADLITKLPLIKQCDKIGGVVYGILQALVIIFIALALITFISTAVNRYGLLELINQSYVGSILNNNNILLKIIF